MSTIVTRAGKGSTLTFAEVDANFTNLNTDKLEFSSEPVRHSVRPSLLLDFANTKQLDPRITFTRASTATFYDGRTTAKAEENLLLQSQFASNWLTAGTVTLTNNTTTAPDGTTTASSIVATSGGTNHYLYQGFTSVVGLQYVTSVYAKANSYNLFYIGDASNGNFAATFNLTTGVLVNLIAGNSATITSVGNGWYRCSILWTSTQAANIPNFIGYPSGATLNAYSASYSGDGTSGVFIWGAQLEQRSAVTAYTPTTTAAITNYIPALQTAASGVARFDHNPTTGESLGLLIEEQRVNLVIRSQEFDSANWDAFGTKIVTANTNIAPDGTLTADTFSSPTGNGIYYSATTTANTIHTASLYCKAIAGTQIRLVGVATSGAIYDTTITISSGQSVGNGWFRVQTTGTTASGDTFIQYRIYSSDGKPVYIWGAQLEAGAFATSYIPTVASQVTRSPDAASLTGTNFSSWYRQDEGTMYAESSTTDTANFPTAASLYLDNNNNIILDTRAASVRAIIFTNGTGVLVRTSTKLASNKISICYKNGSSNVSFNGVAASTDITANTPKNIATLYIGNFSGSGSSGNYQNGTIKKIAYYPLRLSNAELVGLSTI
jgi:hypothetical protein